MTAPDWWFDPARSYEDNYAQGPFGAFAHEPPAVGRPEPQEEFLGLPVGTPFGIAAGPLVNARYCAAAFRHGFDVNAYKTVRTREYSSHPFPNTLAVEVEGDLQTTPQATLTATSNLDTATSISNSFGVPSQAPEVWQGDVAAAVASAGPGQILIGSFQGTPGQGRGATAEAKLIDDHVTCAGLLTAVGTPVLEINLSCPNEGTSALLCYDTALVTRIVVAVKETIGDTPLLVKIAHFDSDDALEAFVRATGEIVDGYASVNSVAAKLVAPDGSQALPGDGRAVSGVCGEAIRWAGLDMTRRLARLREDLGKQFAIVGVGGVMEPQDYVAYRHAGADAVMAATGPMRNSGLGRRVVRAGQRES